MSKFKKMSAVPTKLPALNSVDDIAKLISNFTNADDIFNEKDMKQNMKYLASLLAGWTDRYSPSAFYHALETDKNRGFNDTKHSQGAYEMMSPELVKAVEDFKKNPPSNLTDFVTDKPVKSLENISVPESSGRYKAMQEKLYPSTASSKARFVKTSQKNEVEELKKIMPKWSIQDVLSAMQKVAEKEDYSVAEKQMEMTNILSQYEKEIAPLSQYLEKNGIQPK
jgi:hypothetical protein